MKSALLVPTITALTGDGPLLVPAVNTCASIGETTPKKSPAVSELTVPIIGIIAGFNGFKLSTLQKTVIPTFCVLADLA